jgi:hypothetical protein
MLGVDVGLGTGLLQATRGLYAIVTGILLFVEPRLFTVPVIGRPLAVVMIRVCINRRRVNEREGEGQARRPKRYILHIVKDRVTMNNDD